MKIDEFIEKVNGHDEMQAMKTDEGIIIGISPKLSQTLHGINIYRIPEDATNFIEIDTWATSNSLCWKKPDREYLSALIEEFLHTPIKERFPEKKYRLRWIDDADGSKNYIEDVGYWSFEGLHAETFTEQQLDDLKRKYPRFTPAIDAMKEPVEGE